MHYSTITVKGQIVVPVKLRKKIGLKEGTRVYMEEKEGGILIHPATSAFYERSFGILKGGNLVKELEKTRARDGGIENAKSKRRA